MKISGPDLFDFLASFENLPKWNYYVNRVTKISPGKKGVGTIYHQIRKNDEQTFQVTEYIPYVSLSLETTNHSKPSFRRRFEIKEKGGVTMLMDNFEIDSAAPPIFENLFRRRIRQAVSENLHKLKELLETGKVVLQDGREVEIHQT